MPANANALRWDGGPGHYEVHYVSLTDRASGVGLWIRYTMLAPLPETAQAPTCSLWLMAMDPADGTRFGVTRFGVKEDFPISDLVAHAEPFELRIGSAVLSDRGMTGAIGDVSWDLTWESRLPPAFHVHPLLARARIAKTILTLPHPDLEISGTVTYPDRTLEVDGARGGQAHLWGSKHASRWAWAHGNDFESLEGEPRPDTFFDGVSVYVPRLGREIGPSTPVVGRFGGRDFASTSPLAVTRNESLFGLTTWRFEARDGDRRVVGDVSAARDSLVGVTYHDPDGDEAYCYNAETASMRLHVWEREDGQWSLVESLVSRGRAHFEYAQREPIPGLELHVK